MIRRSDACITYNSLADHHLLRLGVPSTRIFRAQNSIDTAKVPNDIARYQAQAQELRAEWSARGKHVVAYIGAIERRKRIDNLIAAVDLARSEYVQTTLLLIGDGSYAEELRHRLSAAEKSHVRLLGKHVNDAVLYLLTSDVVVLPGQGGLAVNHALACGRPVVATPEADAICDYVKHGVNGYVVEENSPAAIAEALTRIFSDPSLYCRLQQGAVQSGQDLSVARMVDGIEQAIRHAVSA